jgi:predicted acyltransferase
MNKRLLSIDALRGFDMMFIMGVAAIVAATCRLFPGGEDGWLYAQMFHADWDGLRHHDTIFPLFLFIAGISFPFSLEKQRKSGKSRAAIYKKIFRRGLILVLLGILYNGFLVNLNFAEQRYASVLGRIGLAWMLGALIYMNTGWKARTVIVDAILVGYWLVAGFIPAPDADGADIFSAQGSMVGYVDRMWLPGRVLYGNIDPEGLLGIVPAIGTALLGMFCGEWVKCDKEELTGGKKVLCMVVAGVVLLAVGLLWSQVFPINKKMWTSSFVMVVGGYSFLMFALFYYIIDVLRWRRWTLFFTVIGMNSITIYLGQRFINFSYTAKGLFGGLVHKMPEASQDFFTQVAYIAVCWLFLYFLYRKRVFLKV